MSSEEGSIDAAGEAEEFDEDDESDFEETDAIDQMLEKPMDILDSTNNDQVNFYTYDKIQIKSKNFILFKNRLYSNTPFFYRSLLARSSRTSVARRLGTSDSRMRYAAVSTS